MLHINKTLAQQHQVDENVLKVRLNYADNMLKQEGSNIYNLHKQQLQLETVRTFLICVLFFSCKLSFYVIIN